MNKRHYEHTLPNIRGSLSNTYEQIRMAVTISKGNLTQAAALLGISRPTLYKKMGMYGITKEQV